MIHPSAVIHEGAQLGKGVAIGPFCELGPDVVLEDHVKLHGRVSVLGRTRLGTGTEVFTGAVLGGSAQIVGAAPGSACRLEIGPRCVLRENVTLHAGSPAHGGVTRIGAECYFMAGAHAGHDCDIGETCVIANNVALAGHVRLGQQVWIGGQVAVHQYTEIGEHAFIAGGAILVGDVVPFGMAVGNHARLSGLNVTGLKRRGFSRENLRLLRAVYRMLFEGEGTLQTRIGQAMDTFADRPLALRMVDFVRAERRRPLCLPDRS